MRSMRLGYRDIAAEFARRYKVRLRRARRETRGWSLQDTFKGINEFRGNAGLDPDGIAAITALPCQSVKTGPATARAGRVAACPLPPGGPGRRQ